MSGRVLGAEPVVTEPYGTDGPLIVVTWGLGELREHGRRAAVFGLRGESA